jgi:AraC-like DNA-binding protein
VAIDLGYRNPSSFTTMFRRMLGTPLSRYRDGDAGRWFCHGGKSRK